MSYRTSRRVAQRKRTEKKHTILFMQKLLIAPSSCFNLKEHWLITIQIGPNDEGTREVSQTFPLYCTVQQSRAQSEEGSAFCALRLPACLQISEKRCPQLGVVRGGAYCCVEVAQEIEKNPVGISTSPSQLAVKTGRSWGGLEVGTEQTVCALFHVSNWIFLADETGSGSGGSWQLHTRDDRKAQMENEKLKGFWASF